MPKINGKRITYFIFCFVSSLMPLLIALMASHTIEEIFSSISHSDVTTELLVLLVTYLVIAAIATLFTKELNVIGAAIGCCCCGAIGFGSVLIVGSLVKAEAFKVDFFILALIIGGVLGAIIGLFSCLFIILIPNTFGKTSTVSLYNRREANLQKLPPTPPTPKEISYSEHYKELEAIIKLIPSIDGFVFMNYVQENLLRFRQDLKTYSDLLDLEPINLEKRNTAYIQVYIDSSGVWHNLHFIRDSSLKKIKMDYSREIASALFNTRTPTEEQINVAYWATDYMEISNRDDVYFLIPVYTLLLKYGESTCLEKLVEKTKR